MRPTSGRRAVGNDSWRFVLLVVAIEPRRRKRGAHTNRFKVFESHHGGDRLVPKHRLLHRGVHDCEQTFVTGGAHVALELLLGLPRLQVEELISIADFLVQPTAKATWL